MKRTTTLPRKLSVHQMYELLKNSNPKSLELIHLRYKGLLFWIGKKMLQDDFAVETLVQDTFLKLWLHRDTIETPNHILGFLRFVLKRDCITYFNTPKNKFARLTNSLERYENYQDYLVGYDPIIDKENLLQQESDQKKCDEIKKVLYLLHPKRKRLVELCLKYGFHYKPIAEAMGSSTKDISNEVTKAVDELKAILNTNNNQKLPIKVKKKETQQDVPTIQKVEIMKKRLQDKLSFSVIANELKLNEKVVHSEFLLAYQHAQNKNNVEISF